VIASGLARFVFVGRERFATPLARWWSALLNLAAQAALSMPPLPAPCSFDLCVFLLKNHAEARLNAVRAWCFLSE
ncbi:MAG: hypothetical protein AAGA91_20455, partial [Pseudomonadota bacterium]